MVCRSLDSFQEKWEIFLHWFNSSHMRVFIEVVRMDGYMGGVFGYVSFVYRGVFRGRGEVYMGS